MACSTTTGMYLGVSTTICASGSASRSGNTVTISGSFSVSQSGSWNLNAIYAHVSGRTGWTRVKPYSNSGGTWSANFSFSFTDANAGSGTYTAIFQVYNNAESGAVGNQASVNFSASWGSNVSQPANPSIVLTGSTNTSLSFRLGESNWGNSAGRWEWWFDNSATHSGAADATYNLTPTSGYTWNGSADVSKTGLTSNRYYWTHLRVYNQYYNNPGGVSHSKWVTKPQPAVFSLTDTVIPATNYLPSTFSTRPQQGNGITFTDNGDGSIIINGQNDGSAASKFYLFSGTTAGDPPVVLEPGTYHFEAPPDNHINFTIYDGTTYKGVSGPYWEFTITEQKTYTMMSVDIARGSEAVFNNLTYTPKLYDDKGEVHTKAINWEQWTGNGDLELRIGYHLDEGDNNAPLEDTWERLQAIPSGTVAQTVSGSKALGELKAGQTYSLFLLTTNATFSNDGSGRTDIQKISFTTDFPPSADLSCEWNDVRDTLNITAVASPGTDEVQVSYGYTATEHIVVNGINGKTVKTGKIQYPNHGTGQVLYVSTRLRASGNWTDWTRPQAYPVPNPILGIITLPHGEQLNIIDIIEKKVSGKNLFVFPNPITTWPVSQASDYTRVGDNELSTVFTKQANSGGVTCFAQTQIYRLRPNTTYTLSYRMTKNVDAELNECGRVRPRIDGVWSATLFPENVSGDRYRLQFTTGPVGETQFAFYQYHDEMTLGGSGTISWRNIQLERGEEETSFTPYSAQIITSKWKNGKRVRLN